jgi:hypothetical protein
VAVDHHLLDRVVFEQPLERAEADRVAQDQVGDLLAPRSRQDRGGLVDQLADRIGRVRGAIGTVAAIDQTQPQLGRELARLIVSGGDAR